MKTKKAFTLVELLVVISIIVILVGASAIGLQNAFQSARDARRRSDLKQYQTAIESKAGRSNGLYAERTSATRVSTTLCTDLSMTNCPEDPSCRPGDINCTSGYYYRYITEDAANCPTGSWCATQYVLWGFQEDVSSATYLIFCSNGKTGTSATAPSSSNCPL